jgi:FkbM family methyltransferase
MAGLVNRLRSRLHAAAVARDLAAVWRARYDALRTKVRARERRERTERDALKAQSARRARRVPSTETLQHMLRARTALAQRRAAQIDPRPEEAPIVKLDGCARRVAIDGLTWWVPVQSTQSAASVARMLVKQRFPYVGIAQTRDVSVGGVMLDIGANVGRMSIPRVILGDSTRAFCAEADELNYQCLSANIRENRLTGLVAADRVAISDRDGFLRLQRGSVSGSHRVLHASPAAEEDGTVPCTTLDAWVERHGIDLTEVTFVKVDTQGSELHVLSGASRVLAQPHIAWQIEIAPSHLRLAGSNPHTVYQVLTERFSHFVDLNPRATGPRLRTIGDLPAALAYLDAETDAQTDLVLYRACS